ncbi:hypothetical protein GCM10007923_09520 [Shinella yambaruensis]|uniref:Uncharacterized protein n=1 Tax=Shinella yambaruensis TaxID=415996 RepID=A0ABQ5ZGL6_9HYPH|nr:hypothetical protein GCM10007923_09520 [Shinella yambaruensis]
MKSGTVFTAGKFWPELPGVDLMADGKRILTVSEQWLRDNVESIRFSIEPPKSEAPAEIQEPRWKRRPDPYRGGSF